MPNDDIYADANVHVSPHPYIWAWACHTGLSGDHLEVILRVAGETGAPFHAIQPLHRGPFDTWDGNSWRVVGEITSPELRASIHRLARRWQ